jgi:hypothetical protein
MGDFGDRNKVWLGYNFGAGCGFHYAQKGKNKSMQE